MELLAYHHNEAAAGKDVCDTHFAHKQARVDAYISEGDCGRKVSTAKQLAVALSTKSVKNTIVLLVKPKQDAPFRSTNVAAIRGIMNYYSIQYNSEKQKVMFYRNLGQSVPFGVEIWSLLPSLPMMKTLFATVAKVSVALQ